MAVALSLDAFLGWLFALVEHISVWNGLYYAVTTASTVGYGDISPTTTGSKVIAVIMMFTVIPLFAAAYSLMTAGLTTGHLKKHIDKKHDETRTLLQQPALLENSEEDE
jgi:voltage-gated potassium channel